MLNKKIKHFKKPLLLLSAGVLLLLANFSLAQAPTSQPSRVGRNQVRVQCLDPWEQGAGKESECEVTTSATNWTIRYYLEGREKRSLQGRINNLLVFFHPDGYNHLIHEWWGPLVGPGKAIDTNRWLVLSIGGPDDGNPPKTGSPILLSMDEITLSQNAVIEHIFTSLMPGIPAKKRYLVGGASNGGINALAFALRYPKQVHTLLMVSAHPLAPEYSGQEMVEMIDQLRLLELDKGPYAFWTDADKTQFWYDSAVDDVNKSLSDEFFADLNLLSVVGLEPKAYSDTNVARQALIDMWAEGYAQNVEPYWFGARYAAFDQAMSALKPTDLAQLPKRLILAYNLKDQIFSPENVRKFGAMAQMNRRDLELKEIVVNDPQGHNICCSVRQQDDMLSALSRILR